MTKKAMTSGCWTMTWISGLSTSRNSASGPTSGTTTRIAARMSDGVVAVNSTAARLATTISNTAIAIVTSAAAPRATGRDARVGERSRVATGSHIREAATSHAANSSAPTVTITASQT